MDTRTFLDRLDAALVSCAVKLWPELLNALALAGQCAGGVRCLPPDPPGADERPVGRDRNSSEMSERATSCRLPAGMATHAMADPGCAMDVAAANGTRVLSAEEVARVLPDGPETAPIGAGCRRFCSASLGCEVAAGGVSNGEPAYWGARPVQGCEAGVVPSGA